MRLRQARDPQKAVAAAHWSNRIMDSDLVNIIVNVLTIAAPKPLYIATDYAPVTTLSLVFGSVRKWEKHRRDSGRKNRCHGQASAQQYTISVA